MILTNLSKIYFIYELIKFQKKSLKNEKSGDVYRVFIVANGHAE